MTRYSLASFASLASVAIAALVTGCGSTVITGTGGSGGTAGSGGDGGTGATTTTTTTTTTTDTVPPECAVPTNDPGPFAVTFKFTNSSAQQLFLREDCYLNFSVHACSDGYVGSLDLHGDCTVDCADPDPGCIACGACPLSGHPVDPGQSAEASWAGKTFTFATTPDGCSCHETHLAPASKYSIRVPVYLSELDTNDGQPAWTVESQFALPAAGGIVTVDLAKP